MRPEPSISTAYRYPARKVIKPYTQPHVSKDPDDRAVRTAARAGRRHVDRHRASSGFGFALDYARMDARRQANAAGFPNCTEIYVEEWYSYARVIWECTR